MKANQNSVFSDELNRRRFMAGALGFTMTAAMSGPLAAVAQNTGAARGAPRRVDFHHHFIPPLPSRHSYSRAYGLAASRIPASSRAIATSTEQRW